MSNSYRPSYNGPVRGGGRDRDRDRERERDRERDRRERDRTFDNPRRRYDDNPALDRPLGDDRRAFRDERGGGARDGRVGSYHGNRDIRGSGHGRSNRSRSPPAAFPPRRREDTPPRRQREASPSPRQLQRQDGPPNRRPVSPAPSSSRRRSRSPSDLSHSSSNKRQAVQASPAVATSTSLPEAKPGFRARSTSHKAGDAIDALPRLPASPLESGERQDSPLPTSLPSSTSTASLSIRGAAVGRPVVVQSVAKGDARAVASQAASARQQSVEPRRVGTNEPDHDKRTSVLEKGLEQNMEREREPKRDREPESKAPADPVLPSIPKGPRGYRGSSYENAPPPPARNFQARTGPPPSIQQSAPSGPGSSRPNPLKMPPRDRTTNNSDTSYRENAFNPSTAASAGRNAWSRRDTSSSHGRGEDKWGTSKGTGFDRREEPLGRNERSQHSSNDPWSSDRNVQEKEKDAWGTSIQTSGANTSKWANSNEKSDKQDESAWGSTDTKAKEERKPETDGWGTPSVRALEPEAPGGTGAPSKPAEQSQNDAWGGTSPASGNVAAAAATTRSDNAWRATSPAQAPSATRKANAGGAWGNSSPAWGSSTTTAPPDVGEGGGAWGNSSPAWGSTTQASARSTGSSPAHTMQQQHPDRRPPHAQNNNNNSQAPPHSFRSNYSAGRSNPLKVPPQTQNQQRSPHYQHHQHGQGITASNSNQGFTRGGASTDQAVGGLLIKEKTPFVPRPSLCLEVDEAIDKLRLARETTQDVAYLKAAKETRKALRDLEVLEYESLAVSLNRSLRKEQLGRYKENWMAVAMEVDVGI